MAYVLTTASTIECSHGGTVDVTNEPNLKVDNKPVLIGIGPTFSKKCPLTDNASTGTVQCKSAFITGGTASKLKVGGSPVMLDTVMGTTDGGAPPPTPITVKANQSKLFAK